VELVNVPDVPVTVTMAVPVAAVAPAVKVSALVVVTGLGLKDAFTPLGRPVTESVTLPVNRFSGAMVTMLVALLSCKMVTVLGEGESEKFGLPPQYGKLKLPIAVLQLTPLFVPVDCKYSSVSQKVQSSVGSTVKEL